MNLTDFTPQSLLFKVAGWVAIIGLVCITLYAVANHFESIGYQKRVAEDEIQFNKELIASKSQTQILQHQLNEAQNALSKARSTLYTLNTDNRNAVNGLRSNFNTFNSSLPIDTRETLTRRIASLSTVVEDCSARLIEVANDADAAIAEVQMFQNAWPK